MQIGRGVVFSYLVLVNSADAATFFASAVVDYVAATDPNIVSLSDPNSALGKPDPGVPGFPGVPAEPLNPFVPHYTPDQLTQIGPGGSITLRFDEFVNIGDGPELGVFGNAALITVGDHIAGNPAEGFGNDEVKIEVSETGNPGEWAALNSGNRVPVTNPVSYYTDAQGLTGPDEDVANLLPLLAGLTPSDFGRPFINSMGFAAIRWTQYCSD